MFVSGVCSVSTAHRCDALHTLIVSLTGLRLAIFGGLQIGDNGGGSSTIWKYIDVSLHRSKNANHPEVR